MEIAPDKTCFGRWQLDEQRRTLYADGTPVPLNGRAFDLLALLVARHGQAVTREEIFASVWPGINVGENNLTVQVSNLRKVLGDAHGDGAGLIVTVPGRGYKFAGEVEAPRKAAAPAVQAAPPSPPFAPPAVPSAAAVPTTWVRRWGVRVAALAALPILLVGGTILIWLPAPTAPRLSIAVLPFRNLSPDHTQDYLADALTDDLTTDLARIPASTVIAQESTSVWRGKSANVQQIGRALMVRYILEGSLRAEDGRYHVNAQLIDAKAGTHLWAERFDFPNATISEARSTIVGHLALALDFQLSQVESARSVHDRPSDPDALDLFFQARALLDTNNSLDALTRAQHLLERALSQSPDFGDAAAELGAVLMMKVKDTDDPQESADVEEAHRQIAHALALSPRNVLALAARAREFDNVGNWIEASYAAMAALAIDQSNVAAHVELARSARAQGRLKEAEAEIQSVLRLSPLSIGNRRRYLTLGYLQLLRLQSQQAIGSLRQAIAGVDTAHSEGSMGTVEVAKLLLIAATFMTGDTTQARVMYAEYAKLWPNRTVWRFAAYFPKAESRFQGFTATMTALRDAGMPWFADERSSATIPQDACQTGDFEITPLRAGKAETWHTEDMSEQLKDRPDIVVVDLGRGAAVPPVAAWQGWGAISETSIMFADRVLREKGATLGKIVVVMGDGIFGCKAYNTAKTLASTHPEFSVKWYRGGEEAWSAAGLPSADRRP